MRLFLPTWRLQLGHWWVTSLMSLTQKGMRQHGQSLKLQHKSWKIYGKKKVHLSQSCTGFKREIIGWVESEVAQLSLVRMKKVRMQFWGFHEPRPSWQYWRISELKNSSPDPEQYKNPFIKKMLIYKFKSLSRLTFIDQLWSLWTRNWVGCIWNSQTMICFIFITAQTMVPLYLIIVAVAIVFTFIYLFYLDFLGLLKFISVLSLFYFSGFYCFILVHISISIQVFLLVDSYSISIHQLQRIVNLLLKTVLWTEV